MKNSNRIAITKYSCDGKEREILLYLDHHNHPIEFHSYDMSAPSLVGNVYIARVVQVMEQIHAAFLQAGDLKFYFPLEDISNLIFTKKQGNPNRLCQGDELVVQVVRDAIKSKEICVTGNITLQGEHVIVTTGNRRHGVSGKLPGEMRKNLKTTLENYKNLPFGIVVRTSAGEVTTEDIATEIQGLMDVYHQFMSAVAHKTCGYLVRKAPHPFCEHIKRLYWEGCCEFVSDQTVWIDAANEMGLSDMVVRSYMDSSYPMEKLYGVSKMIDDLRNKKVYLSSGGYLIIEHTEALTVIDVNSGKNTKKMDKDTYFLANNREAAIEISKQLRLRNISGIIIIDFINMSQEAHQREPLSLLRSSCKQDYVKVSVLDYTKLGLVEVTREKKFKSVSEQML